jgi:hypothetical protein
MPQVTTRTIHATMPLMLFRDRWIPAALAIGLFACRAQKDTGNALDAGAATPINVAACDGFIERYEKCLPHVPPEQRDVLKASLEKKRAAWLSLAGDPGTRPGLAQACSIALESAENVLEPFHCDWK